MRQTNPWGMFHTLCLVFIVAGVWETMKLDEPRRGIKLVQIQTEPSTVLSHLNSSLVSINESFQKVSLK